MGAPDVPGTCDGELGVVDETDFAFGGGGFGMGMGAADPCFRAYRGVLWSLRFPFPVKAPAVHGHACTDIPVGPIGRQFVQCHNREAAYAQRHLRREVALLFEIIQQEDCFPFDAALAGGHFSVTPNLSCRHPLQWARSWRKTAS